LFHLLLRFYDPDRGRVIVGGQDLRETALDDLRGHIGIVSQDPALFSTTIRENILFGRPDASETEMVACRATGRGAQLYHGAGRRL
jgi:ABC-type multidrug transport system fused ATPase/permease subunit